MNRKIRTFVAAVLLTGMVALMGGCCKDKNPKVNFTLSEIELIVGEEASLSDYVTVSNFDESSEEIKEKLIWESEQPTIAEINSNGVVKGLSVCSDDKKVTVNASYDGVKGSCKLRVKGKGFYFEKLLLYVDGTYELNKPDKDTKDTAFPSGLSCHDFEWKSNDTTVAQIREISDFTVIIHAISEGKAIISASYNDRKAVFEIKVSKDYNVITPDEITLKVGETKNVDISSTGGSFNIHAEIGDNGYYASLPLTTPSVSYNQGSFSNPPIFEYTPEYQYSGLNLVGNHEGTTNLHIYVSEIGFDKLIPVTVLP